MYDSHRSKRLRSLSKTRKNRRSGEEDFRSRRKAYFSSISVQTEEEEVPEILSSGNLIIIPDFPDPSPMILISPISRRIYLDSVVPHSISTQSYTSISIKIIDHSSVSNPKTYHQRRILLPCYASITGSTSPSPPRYPNPPSSHLKNHRPLSHSRHLFPMRGWYQIKITMRWEDADYASSVGTPSRVVQYDAPDLGSDTVLGVWKIDDTDHSFSSQPFRIRYARQDILLSVMIAFQLISC
ncbi:hypothetical protein LXL04_023596 [Taraxacum kok-saghyz]